jgi:3-deoxy-manno-octulosonate cytidylyltransferase (CMP-KDO synthetase)
MAGRPMVQWVYEAAIRSQAFKRVVVATDDERIKKAVRHFSGEAIMTSGDHVSGTERLLEVMKTYGGFDTYFNLQGDEPLIAPGLLRDMVERLNVLPAGSILTPVHRASLEDLDDPNVVKVILDSKGKALYFSRAPIPYQRGRATAPNELYRHIGLYGFSKSVLKEIEQMIAHPVEQMERLEQLRWLLNGVPIYVHLTEYEAFGVDTLDQAKKAEQLLQTKPPTSGDPH